MDSTLLGASSHQTLSGSHYLYSKFTPSDAAEGFCRSTVATADARTDARPTMATRLTWGSFYSAVWRWNAQQGSRHRGSSSSSKRGPSPTHAQKEDSTGEFKQLLQDLVSPEMLLCCSCR